MRMVMVRMRLCSRWIDLIMSCVESIDFSVLINGVPGLYFKLGRRIRQETPYLLYPFMLCSEVFYALLSGEEEKNNFNDFKINKYYPLLSHLFFADDNLIFFNATQKDCQTIKGGFNCYEKASRQTINLDESQFMTSRNTSQAMIDYIQRE